MTLTRRAKPQGSYDDGSFTHHGERLVPGVNVDRVSFDVGHATAARLGYDDATAQMVVGLCLNLWRRGEEDRAERTWLSHYGRDLTSWKVIIAAAIEP